MPSDQLEQALLDYSKKIISQYLYIRNYVLQIHSFFQMIPRRHNDETSLASPQISVDLFHISFFQVIAIIWLFSFLSASPWAHFTKVLQPKLAKKVSKDQVELFSHSRKSKYNLKTVPWCSTSVQRFLCARILDIFGEIINVSGEKFLKRRKPSDTHPKGGSPRKLFYFMDV